MLYHAEGNDRHGYLWTLTNILRLVFTMANELNLLQYCRPLVH